MLGAPLQKEEKKAQPLALNPRRKNISVYLTPRMIEK